MGVLSGNELNWSSWNKFIDDHHAGSFWHRKEWLDYCLAYDPDAQDLSFAMTDYQTNQIIAVCPAIESHGKIHMGDDPCAGPLSVGDSSVIHHLVKEIDTRFKGLQGSWRWNSNPSDRFTSALIDSLLGTLYKFKKTEWDTSIVDLTKMHYSTDKLDHLWRRIRKSYRSLIRAAEREYDLVEQYRGWGHQDPNWDHYKQIHQRKATRPRPEKTYDLQAQWVKSGRASIYVALKHGHEQMPMPEQLEKWMGVATALVIEYKGRGYYASGASLQPNLQHALQWTAMQSLGRRGGKSYELGWVNRHGENDSIGFFKKGFGGNLYLVDAIAGAFGDKED